MSEGRKKRTPWGKLREKGVFKDKEIQESKCFFLCFISSLVKDIIVETNFLRRI